MAKLRLRSAEDFIRRYAEKIDILEFDFIFNETGDKEPILDWYRKLQNPDGGFPALPERIGFFTEDCSCLAMTLLNMRHLFLLGFQDEDVTRDALGFIFSHQEDDGGFHEASAVSFYDVPEWTYPGDKDVILWQTAASLYFALRLEHLRKIEIAKAYEYLKKYWFQQDGFITKYYYPFVYALGAFGLREGTDSERFNDCASVLLRIWQRLPLWEMPHILEICRAVGLTPEHQLVKKALSRIRASQNSSGYWTDGITPSGSPANTIFALIALKRYDLI